MTTLGRPSTDPTGGFQDAKGDYLVNSSTPGASGPSSWLFDPGVLIDEDGKAYLAFGGNGESNARMIQLGSDLVSVSGTATGLAPKGFYEASFLFKRNSIYYYAYSTNPDNGLRIDYLTSTSPMSGYTYGGVIGEGPPENGDNNHASEFEFNGRWYHAYHNRAVAKQAGIPATYRRNLALEVLDFKDDGSIIPVTYTKDGVPQVGTLNPYVRVEAETLNAQSGIETEPCTDGGMAVTQIDNGDWLKVRGVDFGAGAEKFSARVASGAAGGSIRIHQDSNTGTLLGACDVPATGSADTWLAVTCEVSGITGTKDIVFEFVDSGSALFGFDSWQFTATGGAPPAPSVSAGASATAAPLPSGTPPTPTSSPTAAAPGVSAATSASTQAAVSSTPTAQPPTAGPATPTATSSGVSRPVATETIPAPAPSVSSPATSASSTPMDTTAAENSTDACGCVLVGGARDASRPLIALAGLIFAIQRRRKIVCAVRDR
jgi:arabinoxylan arabinofuranohydrolase